MCVYLHIMFYANFLCELFLRNLINKDPPLYEVGVKVSNYWVKLYYPSILQCKPPIPNFIRIH